MAAGRIKGITIEIGGDTTKLTKALSSVDNAISKAKQNLRDLDKALKLDPTNVNLIKDRQLELGKEIENTENKVKKEKAALEELNQKLDQPWDIDHAAEFEANARAAENLKLQIDLDEAELKQLKEEAKNTASVMGTAFQAAGQQIQAVGNKIKSIGDSITAFGTKMTTTVTVPIVTAFGTSAKAAMDWESAFTGVKKTVDESAEGYAQLADNIKQMATETASSANDIAGVMEIAGQLGITGVDGLTSFTKTMVELGDTTNLSAEDAATALARFMNITGESTSSVENIGSAIVALGNNFATSESEITEMATRLASAGTLAGMSSTDILALSAAMSSVGIQAEAGGTAMTQTLTAIEAAVSAFRAGSTEDLEAIANISGLSANDFANAWESHPIGAVQDFIQGLGELDEKGESATLVLDELGMSGVRQSNMLKSLALASEMLGEAVDTSSLAYQNNTALQDEAALRYETMESKMAQLKARFTEIAVEIGEILMPYIQKLMDFVQGLIDKWNGLDESQKELIVQMAAIAAAIGPVALVIGGIVGVISKIVVGIGLLIEHIGLLMPILTNIGTFVTGTILPALAAINAPIIAIVAIIGALTAAIIYLWNTNEGFRETVLSVIESIKTSVLGFIEGLQPMFEQVMTLLTVVKDFVVAVVQELVTSVKTRLDAHRDTLNAIMTTIKLIIEVALVTIKAVVSNTLSFIQNLFKTVLDLIIGIVKTFTAIIKGDWEGALNSIKETASNIINDVLKLFSDLGDNLSSFFGDLVDKFADWGSEMIQGLIDGIRSKISAVGDAVKSVADAIAGYIHFSEPDVGPLSNFHTFMPDMIKEMVQGINQGLPQLENAMSGMASTLVPSAGQLSAGSSSVSNTVTINVYGAQGQDVSELADIIQDRINQAVYSQEAVFA